MSARPAARGKANFRGAGTAERWLGCLGFQDGAGCDGGEGKFFRGVLGKEEEGRMRGLEKCWMSEVLVLW